MARRQAITVQPVALPAVLDGPAQPGAEMSIGGAIEGASRLDRALMTWNASRAAPDVIINGAKDTADARSGDLARNSGHIQNAIQIHKDSIVGAQFRLNANPDWKTIGATEDWATQFQEEAERLWHLSTETDDAWMDVRGRNTFTGLVRQAVASFCITGEILAAAEWIKDDPLRPFKTAINNVNPVRLSNPDGTMDTDTLRKGVLTNPQGRPLAYYIRNGYDVDPYGFGNFQWRRVPSQLSWGRKQIIHIAELLYPDQTRGLADMVSILKETRMGRKFSDLTLQNAAVNASVAAAIESELPTHEVVAMLGNAAGATGTNPFLTFLDSYLGALTGYVDSSKNIQMDGVKIPHLFPGTKLNLKPAGTPGGIGSDFEASLLRHMAAGLNVSYEELTRDYSQISYSGGKMSAAMTGRFMAARKYATADRYASACYALWVEEMWNAGYLPTPPRKGRELFYQPFVKQAMCRCTWIGSSAGQIDELKETQAALLRIQSGLSTWEIECARLGNDWREIFKQRGREDKTQEQLGVSFDTSANRPLTDQASQDNTTGQDTPPKKPAKKKAATA